MLLHTISLQKARVISLFNLAHKFFHVINALAFLTCNSLAANFELIAYLALGTFVWKTKTLRSHF